MTLPLEGYRIIDFTEVWAGPMGMSLLGDLGAEVIKIESFPRASITRPPVAMALAQNAYAGDVSLPRPWDRYSIHNMANRNKLGITVNINDPRGKDLLRSLAPLADALVDGYSAGTVDRLGFGYDEVRKLNPNIVMLSIPGWGVQGPYQGYVTLGSGIDAYVGHHALRAYPDLDIGSAISSVHSDSVAAVTAAFAVLTALHYRNRTGQGQYIDMSQAEVLANHLPAPLLDWVMNQRRMEPAGNRDPHYAPHNLYPCAGDDQWVAIACTNEGQFEALCHAMSRADLLDDDRFDNAAARFANQDELDDEIGAWTRTRSHYDVMRLLQSVGVPAGAVLSNEETFSDPHVRERGFFQRLQHAVAGEHLYPGLLWQLDRTPMRVSRPPNALGQHNREVYGDLLGLSSAQLDELAEGGVIGDVYAADAGQ